MKITKVYVHLFQNPRGKVRASASVVFDDCFRIKDIMVVAKEDEKDVYASMPCRKMPDNKYMAIAYPLTPEFRRELEEAIALEYEAELVRRDQAEVNGEDDASDEIEIDMQEEDDV